MKRRRRTKKDNHERMKERKKERKEKNRKKENAIPNKRKRGLQRHCPRVGGMKAFPNPNNDGKMAVDLPAGIVVREFFFFL